MGKLAVIALGGNALLRGDEEGNIEQQEANTFETIENLIFLLKENYNLVITHGNGPQVGNILMRNDAGEQLHGIAQMPLSVCVADSQGGIGFMIEKMFRNALKNHGIDREIITLVSMVEVSPSDRSFDNPTKRVGRLYSKEEAEELSRQKGWFFKPSTKRNGAYRMVVPSPVPINVLNWPLIKTLSQNGTIVITAGGGGIPFYRDQQNNICTINGVIDKDLTSAVLAQEIGADEFYILTDVPFIYKDFGLPTQEKLERLDYNDTLTYLENGTFAEGTMEPKIKAALKFVKSGGKMCVITEAKKLADKSLGSKITMHYK